MHIVVLGNGQSVCVASAIRLATMADPSIQVRIVDGFDEMTEDDRGVLRTADIVVEQLTTMRRQSVIEDGVPGARHITFPQLDGSFLYPFSTVAHPLNDGSRGPAMPGGYFDASMSDSRLIRLMTQHADETPEQIADRYLALDYGALLDLDALLEITRVKAKALDGRAGVDTWSQIESMFRYEPLFCTGHTPKNGILRPIYHHVLGALGLGLTEAEIEAAAAAAPGFNGGEMPVHPSIARHFGIGWATPRRLYHLPQGDMATIRDYAARFVRFDHDEALVAAVDGAYGAPDDRDAALAALQEARTRHPHNIDLLMHIATLYCQKGDVPKALEAAITATELAPDRPELVKLTCSLTRMLVIPGMQEPVTATFVTPPDAAAATSAEAGPDEPHRHGDDQPQPAEATTAS